MILNVFSHSQRVSLKAKGHFLLQRLVPLRHVSYSTRPSRPQEVAQELYSAPASRSRQILAYVGAATQVFFWGNLAQWAATAYAVKDK
jgi:hypothetical protein